MTDIIEGDYVTVSAEWLRACGYDSLIDAPLRVTQVTDHGYRGHTGRKFYTVELPSGSHWEVWELRGVTKVDAPKPVAPEPEARATPAQGYSESFWARFDKLAAEAAETEDGKAFLANGFRLFANGGGCTAWSLDLDNGWQVLVTDSDGATHALDPNIPGDHWLVGMHGPEGEYSDATEAHSVAEAIEAANVMALARTFVDNLESELASPSTMEEIRRRNATAEYAGSACASHDFCDANMVMAAAFKFIFDRDPEMSNNGIDGMSPDDVLWNRAWTLAKREFLISPKS